MALATLFPISVYMMLTLASCILMYAEGPPYPSPAMLTIPLALMAYLFSERKSTIVLSGWVANILGLVALMVAAREFFSDLEGRLLSGAHLLVYLSWLVIFLPKSRQHYWWTIALSVLQVAVSSVLTEAMSFGFLLLLFLLTSIWTVSLFTVFMAYRDEQEDEQSGVVNHESGMSRRLNPHHVETSSGQVLFGLPSRSIGGVEYDPHAKWVGTRFAGRAMGITFGCLVVGMTFFMCIPRLWSDINPFEEQVMGPITTGFSEKVRLGQMGDILESRQPALAITIYDGNTTRSIPMANYVEEFGMLEPYFRGNVMDRYSQGNWSSSLEDRITMMPYEKIDSDRYFYRQHIELEPLGTQHLFLMHPFSAINIKSPQDDPIVNQLLLTVMRKRSKNNSFVMIYDVYTQKRSPNRRPDEYHHFDLKNRLDLPNRREIQTYFLQYPETELPRIRELTLDIAGLQLSDLPVRVDARREVAQRVVSHLRDSGQFKYSLKSEVLEPEIDPLEDFLINRKQGHCEYYASALALMLRSIGIPTRLVNGYKGGIENEETGKFEVQQRHAHAWTEVYYDQTWHTMDATPAAERDKAVEAVGDSSLSWGELQKKMKLLWSRYVVSMNYNYQSRTIYRFTADEFKAFWNSLEVTFNRWIGQIVEFLKHPERWFSLRGGITAFILLTLLTGIGFVCRWIVRKLRRWFARSQDMRRRRRQVEFYELFLRLCERQQLFKEPTQTPREFSRQVADKWNQLLTDHGWNSLPASLVDKFYAVRFGDELLAPSDEQDLLATLQQLEQAMEISSNGKPKITTA